MDQRTLDCYTEHAAHEDTASLSSLALGVMAGAYFEVYQEEAAKKATNKINWTTEIRPT